MKNYKRFILAFTVLSMLLLAACGAAEPAEETKPEVKTEQEPVEQIPAEIPENSILYFNNDEGSAKLMQSFDDGNVPVEAKVMYDQMGGNPEITVTDPDLIKELYQLLGMVTVTGETDLSVTDCYHHIQFKLADDSYINYSFEGSEIWCYGKKNYSIENSSKLFRFMRELTEEYVEQNG